MESRSFRGWIAGIAILVFFLLTCENAGLGNVGLGKVVDTKAPTASIVEPLPSSFITGEQLFKIKAEDDVGLAKNNPVSIVLASELTDYINGEIKDDPWRPAIYNAADKLYHVSIDTREITNLVDGQYSFKIRARDESGRPPFESDDLVYTVKNGLPTVELLIPKLDWENLETDPEKAPEVLNSGFLSGVASDLQGVEPGYPLLKLWKDGEAEPDWMRPPVPEPNEGGKSFAFRYYTTNSGNETFDTKEYMESGLYHIRFQIVDINGLEATYPETGSALMNITTSAEAPKITITRLANQQQNGAFTIRAEVTHSVGIHAGYVDVFNEYSTNLTFTKEGVKYGIPWASITLDVEEGDRKVVFESLPITPGAALANLAVVNGASGGGGGTFIFPDDTYDFDVEAVSIRADRAAASYANVIIDTAAPTVEITNVAPTSSRDEDTDREYVNGKVLVDFAATDDNGLGLEDDGKRRLKYYVNQTPQTGSADELYEKGEWFDSYPSNGPVTINSAKRMTVNTAYIRPDNGQALYGDNSPLYIYLTAQDKAGNTAFVERVVNIDQSTDYPTFRFTNDPVGSFAELGETPYQTPNVFGSVNARLGGTIEDDDALHVDVDTGGGLRFSIWKEEKGQTPVSADKYTYTVPGLTGSKSVKFDITLDQMGMARNEAGEEIGGGTEENHLSLPEGGYYYTLEMSDLASAKNGLGAVTKETDIYYLAVDLRDPEISVAAPLDNAFVDPASVLTIEGTLVEANNAALKISKPHALGEEPNEEDYIAVAPNGNGDWTITFDQETVIDETNRQITLEAKDRFGRTAKGQLTMQIDREAPVVDLIKFPVENKGNPPAVSSVMSADLSINGTSVDGPVGSASGVEQVFYQITQSAAAPLQPVDYDSSLNGWKLANGGSKWSAVETLSSTQQGSQYLHVFARDAVHNTGVVKSTRFEVDTENPEIGDVLWENAVQVGATRYVNGEFTLKFSVFDSNALNLTDAVSIIRKSGGISEPVTPVLVKSGYYKGDFSAAGYGTQSGYNGTKLWGATLMQKAGTGAGELGSGSYEYTILVKDIANKTATQTFTIAVDVTPPEIEVTGITPTVAESSGVYTVNGIVRVNFNASDNEGIGEDNYGDYPKRQIKYLISASRDLTDAEAIYNNTDEGAVFVDTLNLNYNDGKSGSVMVKASEPKSLYIDTQKLTDKTDVYLYIAGQDRAGNFGYSKTTLRIDQSTDDPIIAFIDIDTAIVTVDDLMGQTPVNLFGADVKIRGTFTDDDAIDVTNVKPKLVIWRENDQESDKKTIELNGLSGGGTVSFNASSQTLGGAFNGGIDADLAEGIYFFTLEVSDSTSGDFEVTPAKTTKVGPFCFAVDTDDPKISVTAPVRNSYQSNTFTLTGTVSDNSNKDPTLSPRLIIRDPDPSTAEEITLKAANYDASTGEWNWTYEVKGISNDNKTVRIIVRDRFHKEMIDDFKVEFDDEAPTVTIKQPVVNNWFEGVTTSFSGSLRDNSQKDLQKVYYFIMKPGVTQVPAVPTSPLDASKEAAAHAAGWREAVISGNTWSVMMELNDDAAVKEGENVLYVIGYDAAGNGPDRNAGNWNGGAPTWSGTWAGETPDRNTAASTLTFGVDRAVPDISKLGIHKTSDTNHATALADKSFIKETFTLYGEVTDTNVLASLVVKQNSEEITLTGKELVKTNGKLWTVNLAGLPRDPSTEGLSTPLTNPEGAYVYTIEVKDESIGLNHTVRLTQTITVDQSGPIVAITSPGEDEPFNSPTITVTGTVDDGTNGAGVSKVYFRVGATGYDAPIGAISADWKEADGTSQWFKNGVNIGSIEGELKFTAFAEDVLGNRSAAKVQNFYVDASNPEILDDNYTGITTEKYANDKFAIKFTAFDSNILNSNDTDDEAGRLAGVVIKRINGDNSVEVFNSYTVSDHFADSANRDTYTDEHGNTLTIGGSYTGVLNARNPSINGYSVEKVWGVALNQNDLARGGDTIGGHLEDGIYDYVITVTDAGGRVVSKTVTITVDSTAPSIDVTKFTELATRDLGSGVLNYVNGVIQFTVSASDENGLAAGNPLQYWILPRATEAPVWETAGGTAFSRSAQPLIDTTNNEAFDQTGTENESAYTLYISAMDKAGNIDVIAYRPAEDKDYSFIVNQSTDEPTWTFDNLNVEDASANFIAGGILSGVAVDDDGFADENSLVVEFAADNGGVLGEWSLTGVELIRTRIGAREIKWSTGLPESMSDGVYYIRLKATDDGAKKVSVGEGDKLFNSPYVQFTLDKTPPVPAITAVGTDNEIAATVKEAPSIKGSLTETNPLRLTLSVKDSAGTVVASTEFDEAALTPDAASVKDWQWGWTSGTPFANLPDGPYTVIVEAVDKVGTQEHSGTVQTVFNKDVKGPAVAFSNLSKEVVLGRELMLEVADDSTDSSAYTGWTAHGLDASATPAEIHTKALEVYAESKGTITDIIRHTDANLRGTFTDEYSGIVRFEYRFDTDPYDENAIDDTSKTLWRSGSGKLGSGGAKNTSWVIPIPAKNDPDSGSPYHSENSTYPVQDGVRRVSIRVYDALDNVTAKPDIAFYLDREGPLFNLNTFAGDASGNDNGGTAYSVVGINNDNDVVFTLKGSIADANIDTLNLTGVAGISLTPSNETEGGKDFTITVTKVQFTALADGSHTFTLNATDIAQNNAQTAWTFVKDTTPPENNFLNMGDQLSANTEDAPFIFGDGSARIMGSTSDVTSGLKSLTYTLQAKNGDAWENRAENQPLTAAPTWNIVLGSGTGGLSLSDGVYRIKVTAEDRAKKTGDADAPNKTVNGTGLPEWIYFVLDTVNPELTVETIKQFYNGGVPLKGTASDANGVEKLEVWFNSSTQRETPQLDADGAWSITMPVDALAEGQQTINVTAYDKAGHTTTRQLNFALDTTQPHEVTVKQPGAPNRVIGSLTVSGVASDNNSVSKVFYQIGKPDLAETTAITTGKAYTITNLGSYDWTDVGAPTGAAIGTSFIATKTTPVDSGTVREWKDTNLDSGNVAEENYGNLSIRWSGGVYAWNVAFNEVKYFVNSNGLAAYDGANGAGERYGVKRYRYTSSSNDALVEYTDGNEAELTDNAPENNVWDIPVNVLIFDLAGNATPCEFIITVDPHMDKATSTILTPDGNQAVGGTVRLTGTSSDNNIVSSVWVRVSGAAHDETDVWVDPADKTKGYKNWSFSEWMADDADSAGDKWYDWTDGTGNPAADTTYAGTTSSDLHREPGVGWHAATIQSPGSGFVNWYINLNANGKLNPSGSDTERTVYIEVFARDTKSEGNYIDEQSSVNGNITRHILRFSSNVPIIENIKVTPQDGTPEDYTYQMQISKTVTITAEVKDSDGISDITVQPTGTAAPISVKDADGMIIDKLTVTAKVDAGNIISAGQSLTAGKRYYRVNAADGQSKTFTAGQNETADNMLYAADDSGYFTYHVNMAINSDELFKDTTGTYGLTLATMDDASPPLSASFAMSFQIDNYFPRADYTAAVTAVGDYTLRGTANDAPPSGSIQGLKSVVVYFSRTVGGNTTFYAPYGTKDGGAITHAVTTDDASSFTTVSARRWNGTMLADPADVKYPKYAATPSYSGYGIVIDSDESATGERDGDNFVEYWYDNAGSEKVWGATFDSTKIADGKITVHYIVEDRAGNRTYAEQDVYFQNNAPSITSLSLATPLVGTDFTNAGTKTISDRYLDTQFTVRNSMFRIGLNTNGGNGQKHYRVQYLTRSTSVATTLTKGKIYTIAQTNAGFDFKTVGAKDNAVGAPFVATKDVDATSLNGASVFEYTETSIKEEGDAGADNTISVDVDFDTGDFGNGKITDSEEYTVVRNGGTLVMGRTYRIEELGNTNWTSLTGLVNPEKGSTFIPSGDITLTGTGVAVSGSDRYFSVKVWDSTLTGGSEEDQLSDFVMLAVRVENADTRPPVTQLYDLNPKAENSLAASVNPVVTAGSTTTVQNTTKGSLYMRDGKISGHIEPRDGVGNGSDIATDKANIWLEHELDVDGNDTGIINPTGFAVDTVSGVVTLRGRAQDDQRITALYLDFGGTARLKILESDTDGKLKRPAGLVETDVGLYQELSIDGHLVEWTYRWDTGTLIGSVTTDTLGAITVTVRAEDASAPQNNAGAAVAGAAKGISADKTNTTDNADYNSIGLDLAPYITTLTRFKNSTGTTDADKAPVLRSKNGWFSFRRSNGDNERLQVEGFNLTDTNRLVIIDTANAGAGTPNGTYYYINVPAGATSGLVTYTAGNIEAVNNRNNNANSWNTSQEAIAGNDSSALWTDDRYVHLFDSHNIENGNNQGHFRNPTVVGSIVKPAMTINPTTGELWASWSSYLINGSAYNNGGTGGNNMPTYYSQNNGNGSAMSITWSADPPEDTDIAWDTSNTRWNMVVLENYMQTNYDMGGLTLIPGTRANAANHKGTWIERFNNTGNQMLLQFINPRIVHDGTRSHITYYDAKYQLLRYWNSDKNAAGNGNNIYGVIIDGTRTVGTGTDAGNYNAIDVNSTRIPVIVYLVQDKAAGTEKLRYAYGNQANATTFTTADVSTQGISTAGRYVSMRIDKNTTAGRQNVMHIVFMDSDNGDLVYVKGTPQGTTGAYSFADPIVIDSVGNVGKWADIAIDADGNPVVSYLDQGGIDSRTGLKMAIHNPAVFDSNGWDHVTLPGRYVVNDVRTQVECDTGAGRSWDAAFAYVSGDYYRISYYVK
ncbi:MAG: Ig-like domain-containing protein [Treponema sp.]|jgi:hypothetical protein|nr:Ig-like domain-containing protein [Treponema sp.]